MCLSHRHRSRILPLTLWLEVAPCRKLWCCADRKNVLCSTPSPAEQQVVQGLGSCKDLYSSHMLKTARDRVWYPMIYFLGSSWALYFFLIVLASASKLSRSLKYSWGASLTVLEHSSRLLGGKSDVTTKFGANCQKARKLLALADFVAGGAAASAGSCAETTSWPSCPGVGAHILRLVGARHLVWSCMLAFYIPQHTTCSGVEVFKLGSRYKPFCRQAPLPTTQLGYPCSNRLQPCATFHMQRIFAELSGVCSPDIVPEPLLTNGLLHTTFLRVMNVVQPSATCRRIVLPRGRANRSW
jgi:hypothetical protein